MPSPAQLLVRCAWASVHPYAIDVSLGDLILPQVRSHASAARTIFSVSHVTHLLPLRATLPLHLVRKPARTSCCALSSLLTHRCTSGWAWAARNPRGTHAAEAGLHTRQRRCEVRASTDGMGLGGDLPTQGAYGAHAERMPCQSICQSHRLNPKPSNLSSSSWLMITMFGDGSGAFRPHDSNSTPSLSPPFTELLTSRTRFKRQPRTLKHMANGSVVWERSKLVQEEYAFRRVIPSRSS